MSETLLEVEDLHTGFSIRRDGKNSFVPAVRGVSFSIGRGEVLGLVGESGCGKTTVGRSIMRLASAQAGAVRLGGRDVLAARGAALRELRLKLRMVFQDPYASLDPRRRIADSVAETGDIHRLFRDRQSRARQVGETLTEVGLNPSFGERFPHELSGGQRQRVGIGRAILPRPELIIADEPVSALDVSIQAQILNLLADLKEQLGLAMLFISHDLGVVGQISDRVAVMYMGRIVEIGPVAEILNAPRHPYTRMLTAARPRIDTSRRIKPGIELGEPPSRVFVGEGCSFRDRCPLATDRCAHDDPKLRPVGAALAACHNIDANGDAVVASTALGDGRN
jgi:oligopeptide/dipeptide ABC transporter ATP-binding protein